MRTLTATTALALLILAQGAAAQTADDPAAAEGAAAAEQPPDEVEVEPELGGAAGLATGAVGETFFIRAPAEYHLLSSEMPGMEVYLDTTATGMQLAAPADAEAAGTVEAAIRDGEQPLGAITDVLLDRRGGAAGLVIELTEEMGGGEREIAVAMGLVRMLPHADDAAQTRIMLTLDAADVESAPTFERPGAPDAAAEALPQDAGVEPTEPEAGEVQPAEAEAGEAQPAEDADAALADDEGAEEPQE